MMHGVLGRYLLGVTALNFSWESLQLPLYAIWNTGTKREMAFAVLHCTIGDMLIAIITLALALIVLAALDWPAKKSLPLKVLTVLAGLVYTVFSERTNLARGAWSYSLHMPVLPWLEMGLTPILQWLLIPVTAFWYAEKADQTPCSINS